MAKKSISYTAALEQLKNIASDLENQKVPLEKLPKTLKEASDLLKYCREQLRSLEDGINKVDDKKQE
jgi:exodeoxyribonuclease VII small subunit